MKHTKIRTSVFETNSSSTHSMCIAKNATLTVPDKLHFAFGEFGWEYETLTSVGEKASYMFTGLYNLNRIEEIKKVIGILEADGIEITYESRDQKNKSADWWDYDSGYVDHMHDMGNFLTALVTDKDKLKSYLFSPLSFVITGNDNDESDTGIHVDYDHDEYYKHN
jgi:hypothetical protein